MPQTNERRRELYKNDPEYKKRQLNRNKRWRENNKQYFKDYEASRYAEKSVKYADYFASYRKDHKEDVKKYNAEYCVKNKERIREKKREYYLKNRDAILKKRKEYQIKNGHQYYLTQKAKGCNTSEAHRKHIRELMDKRRELGTNFLFENRCKGRVERHHLTPDDVVYIPYWLHNMFKHPDTVVHRENLFSLVCQLYPELQDYYGVMYPILLLPRVKIPIEAFLKVETVKST